MQPVAGLKWQDLLGLNGKYIEGVSASQIYSAMTWRSNSAGRGQGAGRCRALLPKGGVKDIHQPWT